MQWEITGGSAFPMIRFTLDKGDNVKAQAGAMVAMSEGVRLEGKADGGLTKAIGRMFSGQSFFMQHVVAETKAGWVLFASPVPGGISNVDIKPGYSLSVQKNGFLAGTAGVDVSTRSQGLLQSMFGGQGFFVVELTGSGTAFLHTYGSMYEIDVPKGEHVLVDNGYLVAWDSNMEYEVTKGASSWFSAVTSGAGFACKFTGPGRILVQTRSPLGLGAWIMPYLPLPQADRQ
jgi:uncharacterized protein (TIGR00266 family)